MICDTAASGEPKLGQNKAAANCRTPDCECGYGAACRYFFFFDEDFLRGTLAPERRAWDNPMAIACFRLFTFFPERPLFRVPFFRSRIAFATFSEAFLPYLAITEPPRSRFAIRGTWKHQSCPSWSAIEVSKPPLEIEPSDEVEHRTSKITGFDRLCGFQLPVVLRLGHDQLYGRGTGIDYQLAYGMARFYRVR
jgi:hypothetical protein